MSGHRGAWACQQQWCYGWSSGRVEGTQPSSQHTASRHVGSVKWETTQPATLEVRTKLVHMASNTNQTPRVGCPDKPHTRSPPAMLCDITRSDTQCPLGNSHHTQCPLGDPHHTQCPLGHSPHTRCPMGHSHHTQVPPWVTPLTSAPPRVQCGGPPPAQWRSGRCLCGRCTRAGRTGWGCSCG